jgi:hypothetical protein
MNNTITNTTFNAGAKTIAFDDFATIEVSRVKVIKNLTTGTYIYRVTDTTLTISVATNVITFTASSTGMNNTDKLFINYDTHEVVGLTDAQLRASAVPVSLTGKATETKQDTIITALGTLLTELQLKADLAEIQPVSVSSIALPTGASTEATLLALKNEVDVISTKIDALTTPSDTQLVDTGLVQGLTDAQLRASALPLAATASTSTLQTTGNNLLTSIDDKLFKGRQSAVGVNSHITIVGVGTPYTGVGELEDSPDVAVSCKTDQAGTLYFDFSNDGTNWDTFPTIGFSVAAGIHEFHKAIKGSRHFRPRFTNTSGNVQTYFRLYTYYGQFDQLNSPLNFTPSTDSDSTTTKSVLVGQTDKGSYRFVPVTPEGHLEVAIHEPVLPFGSIHTENLTPVFQADAVYGVNTGLQRSGVTGSASIDTSESSFDIITGTTAGSVGAIQSNKRLKYRPGQGVVCRFTLECSAGVASSLQYAGLSNGEDALYVGQKDGIYGIAYQRRGKREIRTLTISTGSSTAENATVTLNGVAYTVAVTVNGNVQRTVWEVSQGTFGTWRAVPSGNTVIFISDSSGSLSGAYSFAATSAAGTIVSTRAGLATTEDWIPQTTWNGDKLDGTGESGVTLLPNKKNIFEVSFGFLGTDNLVVKTKQKPANGNNSTWYICHTIGLTNTLDESSFRNPSFAFTAVAISTGATTSVTTSVTSYAGFIEGQKMLHGNRVSFINQPATVTTSLTPIFTVFQPRTFNGRASQVVSNLISITGSFKHTSGGTFYLIKNGTLTGNPTFTQYQTNSPLLWDTATTAVAFSSNDQIIWTNPLAETSSIDHHFTNGSYNAEEVTLQVGEWITLACKTDSGTSTTVKGSLNFRDDI